MPEPSQVALRPSPREPIKRSRRLRSECIRRIFDAVSRAKALDAPCGAIPPAALPEGLRARTERTLEVEDGAVLAGGGLPVCVRRGERLQGEVLRLAAIEAAHDLLEPVGVDGRRGV